MRTPSDAIEHGFRLGDHAIEPARCRIVGPEGARHIEPRAMQVLLALARGAGEPVSRDELIDAVWKHPHVSDEALSRCVSMLRQALGDDAARPHFIETIPKHGYRLVVQPETADAKPPAAARGPWSLAVLPFLNLTGDPAGDYLADGVTEILTANLACMSALRVISRTSAMHYKGSPALLTQIARELDVSRVVEGSVLRSGRQLQVVVQLIDPATDTHLFARTYTRELGDLLQLQGEIAWQVAEEIGGTLEPRRQPLAASPPVSEDAMQAYLRARHFWSQRTPDGFAKALREYEACLAIEPRFAPACAGWADTLIIMAFYGVENPAALAPRALELAQRALALDSGSAEALTARGGVALFFEWDVDGAAALFRRALETNPSHDVARLGLADTRMIRRDFDGGLRELGVALRLNPFDAGLAMNRGDFLMFARRYAEAAAALEQTLDAAPHFWPARARLAEALALQGDRDGATRELTRAVESAPPARLHGTQAFVHALLGDAALAHSFLQALEAARAQRYVRPGEIARAHAALGDVDSALRWIDIGIAEHSPQMVMLGIDPAFERLDGEARFVERLQRLALR
jgi:TolB-like protein/Tfp pilus assembly protein PilF